MLQTPHQDSRDRSADELFRDVYEELRQLAAGQLTREIPGHTLAPTALVHEAYLRLSARSGGWNDRDHVVDSAALAMRNILISHARGKKTLKRGGDRLRVELEGLDLAAPAGTDALLGLDAALTRLATEDPVAAAVVELRYFGGADWDGIAAVLGLTPDAVRQEWCYAKAWLLHRLQGGPTTGP